MLWILMIGFLVGVVAIFLMPTQGTPGVFMTILLGIGGSVVANVVGENYGAFYRDEFSGFVASVLGAMALLLVYQIFSQKFSKNKKTI